MNPTFSLFFVYLVDGVPFGKRKAELIERLDKWCQIKGECEQMNVYYWARNSSMWSG